MGCFNQVKQNIQQWQGFRPLAGCRLVPRKSSGKTWSLRFRPLAGCKCFRSSRPASCRSASFRPLAGCGLFLVCYTGRADLLVSVPLRGVGCFRKVGKTCRGVWFPSPCGVWVVSANLHILFDTAGKRIVNSAVLLYHIDRWFINSKLRETRSAVRSV